VGKAVVKPVVKTLEEPYSSPKFPPRLAWYQVYNKLNVNAEILARVELLQIMQGATKATDDSTVVKIAPEIKPNLVSHRIEVVFWGVRDLKKIQMMQVNKPKVTIEYGDLTITSDTLANARKNLNFTNSIKTFDAVLPEQQEYAPPLCLKMYDCRNFGISVFVGAHVIPTSIFLYTPLTAEVRNRKLRESRRNSLDFTPSLGLETFWFDISSNGVL
jgi:hypothetical protein